MGYRAASLVGVGERPVLLAVDEAQRHQLAEERQSAWAWQRDLLLSGELPQLSFDGRPGQEDRRFLMTLSEQLADIPQLPFDLRGAQQLKLFSWQELLRRSGGDQD